MNELDLLLPVDSYQSYLPIRLFCTPRLYANGIHFIRFQSMLDKVMR